MTGMTSNPFTYFNEELGRDVLRYNDAGQKHTWRESAPKLCVKCAANAQWADVATTPIAFLKRDGVIRRAFTEVQTFYCTYHMKGPK